MRPAAAELVFAEALCVCKLMLLGVVLMTEMFYAGFQRHWCPIRLQDTRGLTLFCGLGGLCGVLMVLHPLGFKPGYWPGNTSRAVLVIRPELQCII